MDIDINTILVPHGVMVAQDGDGQNYELVGLEVHEIDGELAILGWAYPNKDMWFFPADIVVREDGNWLFNSLGRRFRFAPLSAQAEDSVQGAAAWA